jgi:hypothetical protein
VVRAICLPRHSLVSIAGVEGKLYFTHYYDKGHAVTKSVEALRYKSEGSRVRFPMVSLEFFFNIILPDALWPWG